jgi:uncharacterized membrane protein
MKYLRPLFIFFFWLPIIGLSLWFFNANVLTYLSGFRSKVFGDSFFHNQVWVTMHLIGGSLALLLGPLQFWKSFRNRFLSFHRLTGKIYLIGVVLIGISALRLSLISYCVPCRTSLFILSVLILLSSAFAFKAIKAKNIKVHRQFMIRSYVCVLSFVAVRIDDIFPLTFLFGQIEDHLFRRTANEYFFSFVPLLVAEILMIWWPSVKILMVREK